MHRHKSLFGRVAAIGAMLFAIGGSASAATLIHEYGLNGSLADAFAGPALVAQGGTLNATNYSFAADQGLSLSNGLVTNNNYSIEMIFQFSDLNGFRKIIDFNNLTSDSGFYDLSTALNFFPLTTGASGAFAANVNADVVLTRDGATGAVVGYVNGVQQISFIDTTNLAAFTSANNIIQFFHDDNATGGAEASAGIVDQICIFDGALGAQQVGVGGQCTAPTTPPTVGVPEPASLVLLGLGLAGLGFSRRRRAS